MELGSVFKEASRKQKFDPDFGIIFRISISVFKETSRNFVVVFRLNKAG